MSICETCVNPCCVFQSGIDRKSCDFYISVNSPEVQKVINCYVKIIATIIVKGQKMLSDFINALSAAKELKDEEAIKRAYRNLAHIGVDKMSADIILKEWHPEIDMAETETEVIEDGEESDKSWVEGEHQREDRKGEDGGNDAGSNG